MKKYSALTLFILVLTLGSSFADTLRVACIGNSITEGATLSSPSQQSYPAQLNELLGTTYEVMNYGVGGRVMLKKGDYPYWNEIALRRALEYDPNIVTILLGTNDSKPWNWENHKNEYLPDYIAMIDTFRMLDNNAQFLLGYPPPAFSNLGSIRDSVIRNEIIPLIDSVADLTGEAIVDIYHPLLNDRDLFPDGIHPNEAGHDKIAQIFKEAILALPVVVDTFPPYFTDVPVGIRTIYDSAAAFIRVKTAGPSTVKYSAVDQDYDLMEGIFANTGGREHSTVIRGEHAKEYTYYLRARDASGNIMDTSATVSFTFDTTKVLYNWTEPGYIDTSWAAGPAPLGYADLSEIKTAIAAVRTAYFRKLFTIEDKSGLSGIGILIKGNAGMIVYLNGHEIQRINLPQIGEISYATYADEALTINKVVVVNAENGLNYLKNGHNLVAVEVHISPEETSGLSFDSQLFDSNNKIYYSLGSAWRYFDLSVEPADELLDKKPALTIKEAPDLRLDWKLFQNFPNPFNRQTQIQYSLPAAYWVRLEIFDITGAREQILVDERKPPGLYSVWFNGDRLASGFYYFRLQAGPFRQVRRMLLIR